MFIHLSFSHSVDGGGGLGVWGCGIPACLAGLQAHPQGEVEGSGLAGVSRFTSEGVSMPTTGGGVSAPVHAGMRTPPDQRQAATPTSPPPRKIRATR